LARMPPSGTGDAKVSDPREINRKFGSGDRTSKKKKGTPKKRGGRKKKKKSQGVAGKGPRKKKELTRLKPLGKREP